MRIGYARVSTQDQSLDLQVDALKKAGCNRIFKEKISGKRNSRPELQKMLDTLREKDTVVVYKLDRISRSTRHLIELVESFEDMGIEFVSLEDQIDTRSPMGRFFFRMMASIAELERDILSERTKAGLNAARARGRVGGRPKVDPNKIQIALRMYDSKEYTLSEIKNATGIGSTTLYRYINQRKSIEAKEQLNDI
ncbi:recombinase family protein [Savagea faecisuis]|uniref:Recombinase family protein n=1 Tax=Savagea faecisuis TaxID=1274803 RepID=A0ABW3GZE3_9BACL